MIHLKAPALRERPDDVDSLVTHFAPAPGANSAQRPGPLAFESYGSWTKANGSATWPWSCSCNSG
ncbi:MAG: hypothetical protein HY791_06545 [Deltaproteobacteria bacterium]|nr:hypothetical protein [Deltaproteobacteria bacterium]